MIASAGTLPPKSVRSSGETGATAAVAKGPPLWVKRAVRRKPFWSLSTKSTGAVTPAG